MNDMNVSGLQPNRNALAFYPVMLALTGALWLSPVAGQSQEAELLTGADLRATLEQPIDAVSWKGKSFAGALSRIRETQYVAVMLDRRVDPDQTIEYQARGVPLETMIDQFAQRYGAATCLIGPVVYVGPEETCRLLPTVAELRREEVRNLPAARQRQLLRTTPWNWERLSSPRDLLSQLEEDYAIRIEGKENMPHDLWPQVQLPAVDFVTKLSLVLGGFHVTFVWNAGGDAVRVVAMPESASIQRSYDTGARSASLAKLFATKFADATIKARGNQLVVDGSAEVHEAVKRLLSGEPVRRPPEEGNKNYTLNVENKPAGGVVRALGAQLGKEVVFDVTVKRRLTKEISISVKEVSLDELLTAVLTPAGLKYELEGDTIRVFD